MDELELTPQFRVEYFLDAIVNSTDCPYEARDRIEMFLERIAGADIVTPPPMYRIEFYLAKIAGDDVEIPEPQHRAEFYLAAICGEDVELPEPHDRIDYWLYQWAEGGSLPWQTFTGNPLQFNAPKAHTLRSTVVTFTPKQDLHGYSNPWPAGGGKNKVIYPYFSGSSAEINGVTFTVDSNGVITANGLASANAEFILVQASPVSLTAGDWTISGLPSGGGSASFVWNTYGHDPDNTMVFDRRTGAESYTFNCPNGLKDLYIGLRIISGYNCQNLKVYPQFEAGSTSTPWTPYSNICPISGWNSLDVVRAGENLLNPNDPDFGLYTIDASGGETTTTPDRISSGYIRCDAGVSVLADSKIDTSYSAKWVFAGIAAFDINKNYLGRVIVTASNNPIIYTTPANTAYIRFFEQITKVSTITSPSVFATYEQMLVFGATAPAEYIPYTGETTTLSFPSTVYGGTAEVAEDGSGSGASRKAYVLLDDPNKWYIPQSTSADFAYDITFADAKNMGDSYSGMNCSYVPVVYGSEPYGRWLGATNHKFGIKWASGNLADIKAAASAGLIAISYELETPTPFTPTVTGQPTAAQGINTMWTDGGSLTVEAKAEAVNLSALQSLNMLLGGRYYNNGTADEPTDEEALDVILGGQR